MDPETQWYAHKVGVSLTSMGVIGVILNVVCLVYFIKLKADADSTIYARVAFINLAVVDLLLSLSACCIRGPAYIDPVLMWGDDVVHRIGGRSDWCETGLLVLWFLVDLSMLSVIPLSFLFLLLYVPCMALSKRNLGLCIVSCWCIPALEIVFIVSSIATGKLTLKYEDIYRRCTLRGEYEHYLNRENSTVFFAIPLFLQVLSWSMIIFFVCRHGNSFQDTQWRKFFRTGITVVVAFTLTWLPYFVTVVWQDIEPSGWFAFVFCFLNASTILNPLIYGMASMKFNGQTISEVLTECCITMRARALSQPRRGGGGNQASAVQYSSYDDVDGGGDMEDMNTIIT